jgi:peptidoglycan/xylan/chitin deacetylase (PgdA/CDA1 family)
MEAPAMAADIQVCLSFDFDAMSLWIANFQTDSPNALSRGEFGGRVGAPRLLDLLAARGIRSTWFIPGHTAEAFPDVCRRIAAEGHEIGHHGYCHENPRRLEPEQEERVIERGIACLEAITGQPPVGYRSPSGSFTQRTLELLHRHGFVYDSSMMADDFTPYYCRVGDQAPPDGPYVFGRSIDLVELPFSWNLDDFPFFEYTASRRGISPGLADPARVLSVWWGEFEFLRRKLGRGVYTLTLHPQVIGRGHRLLMLEELLDRMAGVDGVSFTTMSEVAARWKKDNPLRERRA